MLRWTDPAATPDELRPCVATFGNFDGVHRGHQAVLNELVRQARSRGLPAVAVTFDPHPVMIFHPEHGHELIAPGALREQLVEDLGVDGLMVLHFTAEFAQQTAEEFVRRTFVEALQATVLVVGRDTRGFGRGYTGDVDLLRLMGQTYGFEVVALDDQGDSERWSSTAVRQHLIAGEVAAAARILGRPHRVIGEVVYGHARGRELGYPTANLSQESLGMVPLDGVYAGWFTRLDLPEGAPDRRMPAAISVGNNPTFGPGDRRTVEAYVLDRTDLDLYGEEVMIEFVAHLRPTLKFDSVDDLMAAMASDVARARTVMAEAPVES